MTEGYRHASQRRHSTDPENLLPSLARGIQKRQRRCGMVLPDGARGVADLVDGTRRESASM